VSLTVRLSLLRNQTVKYQANHVAILCYKCDSPEPQPGLSAAYFIAATLYDVCLVFVLNITLVDRQFDVQRVANMAANMAEVELSPGEIAVVGQEPVSKPFRDNLNVKIMCPDCQEE
jgi:hypothetical protein